MKKTLTLIISAGLIASASAATFALQTGTNVALGTTGITYTTTGFNDSNPNGDIGTTNGNNTTLTIVFSAPVNLEITSTSVRYGNVFDGGPGVASSTFVTDGSAWSFSAGSNAANANFTNLAGNSFGISQDNGQNTSGSQLDWGTLTSSGVTTLTWNITSTNREVVKFCADAVPEPTSAALLGLGGLALLGKRRR